MRKYIILTLALFLTITVFSQKNVVLKILQTSDVHGAIFPFDFINNRPMETSLSQVYTYVLQERANKNQQVILLDNGDILQGQPTVYYSNFIDTLNKNIVSRVYNFMGYDAATIGNHDIEAGPKVYLKVAREINLPLLGANIINEKTNEPAYKPYIVIKRAGVKTVVLGLTTPGIPNWLPKVLWPDYRFDDMILTTSKWVEIIQEKEKPDVLIGLFHSGHNANYGSKNPDELFNENASLMIAKQIPGFDAILIGHDHDRLCQKFLSTSGDSVLILDPGSSARYISETTISISIGKKGEIKKQIKGKLVETKNFIPDPSFMSEFGDYSKKVETFVNRKIGEFTATSTTADAYFGPSSFIDFINNAQLSIGNAEVSFAAPLTFDATIEKGPVYVRDMFKLYKFENFLYTMNLTGLEIDKFLEHSYKLWMNTMKSPDDHLIRFKLNDDGSLDLRRDGKVQLASNYYSFDSALGIIYTVDVSKPAGERVNIISMADGTPFDTNKVYKVAINSYRGNGGGGHLTEGCGINQEELKNRISFSTVKDLRYYILKKIESEGVVTPKSFNQWKILPEDWAMNAAVKDRELLFGKSK